METHNQTDELKVRRNITVPIWKKTNLTLEEAAAYSNIGINRIRMLSSEPNCKFVLFVGNKRLIKRKKFDEYIETVDYL